MSVNSSPLESLLPLLEATPVIVYSYTYGPDGLKVTYVSHSAQRITGYTPEELISDAKMWLSKIHPDDVERVTENMRRPRVADEYRLRTSGGRYVWMYDKQYLIAEDEAGIKVVGIAWDITSRKVAEENLRKREAQLRGIVEDQTELICRFLPGGILTFVNKAYCDYFGKSEDELLGQSFMPLIPEEDRTLIAEAQSKISSDQPVVSYEHRVILSNGEVRWHSWTDRALYDDKGHVTEYQAVGRDITSLRELLAQAEISERRYRAIVQDQTELICRFTPDGTLSFVNNAYASYFGKHPEELIGKRFVPAGINGDQDVLVRSRENLDPAKPTISFERKVVLDSGETRWQEWSSRAFFDDQGNVTEYQAVGRDTTERVKMQEQLEKARTELEVRVAERTEELRKANKLLLAEASERERTAEMLKRERNRLAITLYSIGEGVITTDAQGMVTFLNRRAAEITGHGMYEAINRPLREIFVVPGSPGASQGMEHPLQALALDRNPKSPTEHLLIDSSGNRLLLATTANSISAGESDTLLGYILTFRDLTGQRRREARLAMAQKLESVGRMAAGIAHELNSPLQYVGDNARYLQRTIAEVGAVVAEAGLSCQDHAWSETYAHTKSLLGEEIPQALEDLLEGVERVTALVRSIRVLSHPGERREGPVNLNDVVQSVTTVSRHEMRVIASLHTVLDEDLPAVPGSHSEISQAVLNVLINSIHAVEDAIRQGRYRHGEIEISTGLAEEYAFLRVRDNGKGIDPGIMDKLFDPFFTTKEVGRGTGQGLPITYDIISNKHGGRIEVESEPDVGSTFTLYLPLGVTGMNR
jgi:PAS domain S-box-containing protein